MVSAKSDQRPPEAHLALEAADRKERLLALRRRKAGESDDTLPGHPFTFRHRNFNPSTRQPIRADQSRPAVVADVETVERRVQGLAERIIADDAVKRMEELDLLNIAPKRANWDLRRDMDKRTKKLERQTAQAYATLFRQRLVANKSADPARAMGTIPSGQDLVASMDAAERERTRREGRGGGGGGGSGEDESGDESD
ncbi:hypothetical protein NliqN6_3872 [Naganishia liquefaciens]|uniref:Coiled-coil domain-containing protein 12 n=1 Tax=Naganishia liquefaciens TaxID=104408 RepID=A0A8H3TUH9_9TREE|nr:hypothetical protein NliqN6_3872 [Naganishia liquefaciens]